MPIQPFWGHCPTSRATRIPNKSFFWNFIYFSCSLWICFFIVKKFLFWTKIFFGWFFKVKHSNKCSLRIIGRETWLIIVHPKKKFRGCANGYKGLISWSMHGQTKKIVSLMYLTWLQNFKNIFYCFNPWKNWHPYSIFYHCIWLKMENFSFVIFQKVNFDWRYLKIFGNWKVD